MGKASITLLLCALLLAPLAKIGAETLELTTIADPELPSNAGLLALVSAVFEDSGYQVVVRQADGDLALRDLDEGRGDGDFGRMGGLEAQFPDLIEVPEPLLTVSMWAVSARDLSVGGIDDIIGRGLSIVTVQGNKTAERSVESKLATGRYKVAGSVEEALGMLVPGRSDILIGTDIVLAPFLARPEYSRLSIAGTLFTFDAFIYLNRRWAALVPRLAESLRKMKAR